MFVEYRDSSLRRGPSRFWYGLTRWGLWLLLKVYCRARCQGRQFVPKQGPVLFLVNHPSYLDPLVLGAHAPRRINFVLRNSLRAEWLVRFVAHRLGVILIDEKWPAKSAFKLIVDLLGSDGCVALFPEGTRSLDGRIGNFRTGLRLLLKNPELRIVPVGLRGVERVLSRRVRFPRPRHCSVHFGAPMTVDEVLAPDGVDRLRRRLGELADQQLLVLAPKMRKTAGGPSPGGGRIGEVRGAAEG